MGSVPGSIMASLVLGVLESFGGVYISYQYRDTFGLIILICSCCSGRRACSASGAREV